MHRWNRSTVEHTDISCISSLLASIKSSRACIMEFPSLGSHLHLVIVSDKSSRGEVADLIARILTRWKSWQRSWPRVSGGWQWEPSWDQGGGGGEEGRCLSFDFHLSTLSRLLRWIYIAIIWLGNTYLPQIRFSPVNTEQIIKVKILLEFH